MFYITFRSIDYLYVNYDNFGGNLHRYDSQGHLYVHIYVNIEKTNVSMDK